MILALLSRIPLSTWLIGGAVAFGIFYHLHARSEAYEQGRAAERAAIAEATKRKLNDATIADDAHNRCVADPKCRVSNDGYRRD